MASHRSSSIIQRLLSRQSSIELESGQPPVRVDASQPITQRPGLAYQCGAGGGRDSERGETSVSLVDVFVTFAVLACLGLFVLAFLIYLWRVVIEPLIQHRHKERDTKPATGPTQKFEPVSKRQLTSEDRCDPIEKKPPTIAPVQKKPPTVAPVQTLPTEDKSKTHCLQCGRHHNFCICGKYRAEPRTVIVIEKDGTMYQKKKWQSVSV